MSRQMLAVFSSNHHQRSGRNLADGHAIPGSGLLLTTWQTPTLGFRKQERMLRTGSTGGCLRSIAQRTCSGARSYWIGGYWHNDDVMFKTSRHIIWWSCAGHKLIYWLRVYAMSYEQVMIVVLYFSMIADQNAFRPSWIQTFLMETT